MKEHIFSKTTFDSIDRRLQKTGILYLSKSQISTIRNASLVNKYSFIIYQEVQEFKYISVIGKTESHV